MKRLIVFFLVMCCTIAISTYAEAQQTEKRNKNLIVKVSFSEPLSLAKVKRLADRNLFEIAMLEGEFEFGGVTHYEFYTVQPGMNLASADLSALQRDYQEKRFALMQSVLASAGDLENDFFVQSDTMLASMRHAVATADTGPVLVSKAVILANRTDISQLMEHSADLIQNIEVEDAVRYQEKLNRKAMRQETTESELDVMSTTSSSTWWPNVGYSYTYPYSSTQRYTLQYMGWYAPAFTWTQTYEHDYFLYNYDRATYLNGGSTAYPGCFPVVQYAATTWPAGSYPYLDTRFNYTGCEVNELAYTIGAAQASAIPGGVWHYNYIITANGNASSDRFKLQAQRGYRSPSSCYTTWCSFGDYILNLVPAWNSTVPGTVYWTR